MNDQMILLPLIIFALTIFVMIWKPFRINETIPTTIGASLFLLFGIVPLSDLLSIFNIVSGAAITILSSIVMSIILESLGFFNWVAYNLVNRAKQSGLKLFIYTTALCFAMTLFFNNDGSILITTPIIIKTVNMLNLKNNQKIAYLLPGALIATAASAPIAVSNIANLIALKIVGLDINSYVSLMFVPSMIGIGVITLLLYLYFKKDIPKKLPNLKLHMKNYEVNKRSLPHPLSIHTTSPQVDWGLFKICMIIIVATRAGFFLLTPFGISLEWIAIIGAAALIAVRWFKSKVGVKDVVKKTPWHILLFAFSMYILVYGLHNIGLTDVLIQQLSDVVKQDRLSAIFTMGGLLTVLSNTFNNLPAVMIGTLTLTEMDLDAHTLQVAYLANIIGSDIGALLTPVGTLATLLWMFILREHKIHISWKQYTKIAFIVIPLGLIISLLSLYLWTNWIFG
ncbi:arsenic transporter [Pseudalkalibacillus salsuginis]|uniref:arsenic transporter n=1 Tax=Pseudalkalibacillus salsuginis TaxID=2910972 RepID=UPI001F1A5861|nr:arsenic transporter [Pseudalkalibacillus salsuginis]MCF6409417.1 arsenic transporter [Pseudalkalibacillus salsuginis]